MVRRTKLHAVGLAISLLAACASFQGNEDLGAAPGTEDPLQKEQISGELGLALDKSLRALERKGFAGSVLVAKNRRIALLKGYGLADIERGIPNSPATRFEMNSITKTFTGAVILQLASNDRLPLDTPLEKIFGNFPPEKRVATIRQLACHTAGLVIAGASLSSETRESFLQDVKEAKRESEPGKSYRYTNAGYSLLAAAIERVTGQSFEEQIRQKAFKPAGLRTAIFANERNRDIHAAQGYSSGGAAQQPIPYVWGRIGAAGVWATVGDMYRWVLALQDGKIVQGQMQEELFRPPDPPSDECFGWHVYPRTDHMPARIEKGGGSAEFSSQIIYFPETDILIIWANNNLEKRWRSQLNRVLSEISRKDNA